MAKKSANRVPVFEATIGPKCRLMGTLQLFGGARIEGSVQGEITADADLVIGERAEVEASINGERVQVFGKVSGDIVCSELLEIFAGAQVVGNISSPRLVMHDGVQFDGYCRMHSAAAAEDQGKIVELTARDGKR